MTLYKFEETDEKTVVKLGNDVHLECYVGAERTNGLGDDIHAPMAEIKGAPRRPGAPNQWSWTGRANPNDVKFARQLGYWAIKKTRSALPMGTFNNMMAEVDAQGKSVKDAERNNKVKRGYRTPVKKIQNVDCQLAPRKLVSCAESWFAALSRDNARQVDNPEWTNEMCQKEWEDGHVGWTDQDYTNLGLKKQKDHTRCQNHKISAARNHVFQMAAREMGCRLVGGGVCSLVSHVTAGFLTTGVPESKDPDHPTQIAIVYSGFDHSFCILKFGTAPWMAVDPWVHRPYVIPMGQCLFNWGSLKNNFRVVIKKPVDVPFGMTWGGDRGGADELRFTDLEVRQAMTRSGIVDWRKRGQENQRDYPDGWWRPLAEIKGECMGSAQSRENWFHMCDLSTEPAHDVWFHVDNLRYPSQEDGCHARVGAYGEPSCARRCEHGCKHGDPDLVAGHLDTLSPAAGADGWGDPRDWKPVKTVKEYWTADNA